MKATTGATAVFADCLQSGPMTPMKKLRKRWLNPKSEKTVLSSQNNFFLVSLDEIVAE